MKYIYIYIYIYIYYWYQVLEAFALTILGCTGPRQRVCQLPCGYIYKEYMRIGFYMNVELINKKSLIILAYKSKFFFQMQNNYDINAQDLMREHVFCVS